LTFLFIKKEGGDAFKIKFVRPYFGQQRIKKEIVCEK
jgi:hypothetical protein